RGAPEQRIMDLVKQKMISPKAVLNASQFRDLAGLGTTGKASDLEDLFEPAQYLEFFNAAYATQLGRTVIRESDLPPGDRIVDRIERHLDVSGIKLRPSGGFNHYVVASHFASNP